MVRKQAAVPTDCDLLYEEAPVENRMHGQMAWNDLVLPLQGWAQRTGFRLIVGSNSPVAFAPGREALGPDVWAVNGGEERGQLGWVPWREGGLTPNLVIEMLSNSTELRDRGEKLRIYRDILKTVDHFFFQSETGGVEYRRLVNGVYVRKHADRNGRFRCASLPLSLGVLEGRLRWFDRNGLLLPTYSEIDLARASERAHAEAEHQRAERLLARLRELGADE